MKSNNASLTANSEYTYDKSTGEVVIYKASIKGAIVVSATGVRCYSVTFLDFESNSVMSPVSISTGGTYTFVESPLVTNYHHTVWYENNNLNSASYAVDSSVTITSNRTFYAYYA